MTAVDPAALAERERARELAEFCRHAAGVADRHGAVLVRGSRLRDLAAAVEELDRRARDAEARAKEAEATGRQWAADAVERRLNMLDRIADLRDERGEDGKPARNTVRWLRLQLFGGSGCVIAPFDPRRPEWEELLNERE